MAGVPHDERDCDRRSMVEPMDLIAIVVKQWRTRHMLEFIYGGCVEDPLHLYVFRGVARCAKKDQHCVYILEKGL